MMGTVIVLERVDSAHELTFHSSPGLFSGPNSSPGLFSGPNSSPGLFSGLS